MGSVNKLLLEIDGTPLVRHVADVALAARLDPVVVVVGQGAGEVQGTLSGLPLFFANNAHPEAGMSSSIRAGLDALDGLAPSAAGALVMLGDMPWVQAGDVMALLSAFNASSGREICVPTNQGRRGNPVLWSARFFAEMRELHGDVGARDLMERHAGSVHEVEVEGAGILTDVDTPEAFQAARGEAPPPR